ncbi:MAG: glycosyltransferase [Gammaproteobacteria bacterium]|nr:glycosyltransferase [Gammaproteobacteria bacterium]
MAAASAASRVAVVIDPWDHPFNGTVVSARRFVAALTAEGWDFRLLTIDSEPEAEGCQRIGFPELRLPGVQHLIDRMRAPLARPQRRRLREALRGCDLLHVQFPFLLGHAAIGVARSLGVPVVCSFHVQPENVLRNLGIDNAALCRALYALFLHRFYQRADHVVAPSSFAAEHLQAAGLTRPWSVISNGVPEALFGLPRCPGTDGRFHILSVGRLATEKDQASLIEAVARSRHKADITLHLVGIGPLQERLVTRARALNLDAHIGPADDATLLDHYARADLVVHCGRVELEGMAVLEAMASGNAVLVAEAESSAASRLIGDAAWRFPAGDVDLLSSRIDEALASSAERAQAGAVNRVAAAPHSHPRCAQALADLYRAVMGAPQACRT